MLIFIYSLCFYLYILQCNSGFDLHIYIPLYLFTVHLLYNHCILIRYSYYIVVTYVHIVVSYYFFLYLIMNWSLSVFIALSSFPVDNCIKLYCMFLHMGQLYLHIFTHLCLYIYISDILSTYVLYICSIQVWHSYQLYLFVCICTSYTVMVVLIDICIFHYIYIYCTFTI